MPVANVRSKWTAGNLIFYESVAGNGASVQFGEDGSGMDTILGRGTTASNYMQWDASANSLLLVGTAVRFSLGSFTGAAIGTGSVVSATATAPFKVFADDGGAAIGSGSLVRAGWFRNLQTYTGGNREQEATGVQGSLVSVAGTNRHNMSGVLGSYEARTSLTVGGQAATTDTWIQAAILGRVGAATNVITVDTNGVLAGVAAMSNVTTQLTSNSGVYAGYYVGKWGGDTAKASWSHGIYIQALAVDKAIQVGELSSTTVGSGVTLTDSVTRVMEIHADDGNAARTGGVQGRAILGRTMIYANTTQENWGVDGLLKWSGVIKTANVDAGVVGRFESTGTCQTSTGSGNTFVAGVMGRLGLGSGFTIDSSTYACGVLSFYNTLAANDPTGETTCAFMATATDFAGAGDWDYGLFVEDTAIAAYLRTTTKGMDISVSTVPSAGYGNSWKAYQASAKSDGLAGYFEGHMTGTSTGPTYALGAWMNVDSGTHGSHTYALDVGVYASDAAYAGGVIVAANFFTYVSNNTSGPTVHAMFRFNTDISEDVPDYWFMAANPQSIALVDNTDVAGTKIAAIAIQVSGSAADPGYIWVYDSTGA